MSTETSLIICGVAFAATPLMGRWAAVTEKWLASIISNLTHHPE